VLSTLGAACTASDTGPVSTTRDDTSNGSTATPLIWAIGDSLMVGAMEQLTAAWSKIVIDAEVGRSVEGGIDVLEHRLATGSPDVLVFALGTNNGATAEQIARVMRLASDIDKVVFVNVAVPRPWEAASNIAILEATGTYANATSVDWKTGSATGNGLFRADGYHLTADGVSLWVDMIMAEATG